MLWGRIKGHEQTLERLDRIISQGRPAHAYLFSGPRGVGKAETARVFAAALNCGPACGTCASCRAVFNQTHTDFHYIAPEGSRAILREQVMELLHALNLKQQSDQYKVAVIDDAQVLGPEAANAVLKTLEEPPGNVVFILVADDAGQVLPTISSRCQRIRFEALSADIVHDILVSKHGIEPDRARLAARLARGMVGEAIEMAGNGLLDFRSDLIETLLTEKPGIKARAHLASRIVSAAKSGGNELKQAQADELAEMEALAGGPGKLSAGVKKKVAARHKRESARAERLIYKQTLVLTASIFRDMLLISENADKKFITNSDLLSDREFEREAAYDKVSLALKRIDRAERWIEQNVNPLMALENLFFAI
jgi:DNA polymerase-3 subunit delta'